MTKLGVLDIGTNSIHLVLAEVEPDFSYKILDRFKDMTRLGDGTFETRRLSEASMARGLEVIRNLVTLARNKGYEQIEAVATSAVREAKNGGEFIEAVARQTGLTVRVVTGQEEARLIYLGVRHSMDLAGKPTLIVDVGGGSVELIVGTDRSMLQGQSIKLGAIRLKDLFLQRDPPGKSMIKALRQAVESAIESALRRFRVKRYSRLVGTSGMIGNLAEVIHLRRNGRPLAQTNMATFTLKDVLAVEKDLFASDFTTRLSIPGLDPKRADTLLPATTVIRTLMERTGQEVLTVSNSAIREGLIYDFIEHHREGLRAEQEIPNIRRRHIISLARRSHYPESHCHHVAALALRLFDATKSLHGMGEPEREWLEYAALLHDIGYHVNLRQHHKHTYYLITNSDLHGFTADEIETIANVARYHRRALPQSKHASWKALSSSQRKTVEKLSALLRIADGLDRSHFSVVRSFRVKMDKKVTLLLDTISDSELEIWAARGRADLFERIFQRPVEFVVHRLHSERT
jgi:exopolyphosphatase/guanosine-5'-triphosphate,3'-diphosphate pyrophosphatase